MSTINISSTPSLIFSLDNTLVDDSSINSPSTTVSIGATDQSSTGSNTLAAVFSTVFILLVVTILVILIVSVLVCRRRFKKGNDTSENERYTHPHTVSSRSNNNYIEQQPQGILLFSIFIN